MSINRHTPYRFKTGQTMRNRVIVPPMASQTADESGFVTDRTIEHYRRLGRSNAGLIFVEYSFIHQTGKGKQTNLGLTPTPTSRDSNKSLQLSINHRQWLAYNWFTLAGRHPRI